MDRMDRSREESLKDSISAAKEAAERLKFTRLSKAEDMTRLLKYSQQVEYRLANGREEEELFRGTEDVLFGSPIFGYGTKMIGKTVLEASVYCNRLTGDGSDKSQKELVNLILGKAEVAKAEMLKIILSDKTAEEKRAEIDAQFEEAKDYFESILYQMR